MKRLCMGFNRNVTTWMKAAPLFHGVIPGRGRSRVPGTHATDFG